jgi:DNA recombination protein RmuC
MSAVSAKLTDMDTTTVIIAVGALILGLAVGLIAGQRLKRSGSADSVNPAEAIETARVLATAQEAIRGKDEIISRLEAQLEDKRERDEEERSLLEQFAPLKKQMDDLQREVTRKEEAAAEAFTEIRTQLETAERTDAMLKNQTAALANALSTPGTKGAWGELTLERLLESFGMLPNVDFLKKEKLEADEEDPEKKKRLPDVVIRMPKDRYVAVDSKVPYTNYLAAMDAEDEVTDGDFSKRDALLKNYITDIKRQIDGLSKKGYDNGLPSAPEFTVLYMPNEPALSVALRIEPALMEYAFHRKIVLVTPSSFYTVLKTVSHIWSRSEDEETVNAVITLGQKLMQQIRLLADDVTSVRKGLRTATDGYNAMTKRMNSTFIDAARKVGENPALAQSASGMESPAELDVQLNDLTASEYKALPEAEEN